jgi:hypothetical protein
MYAFYLYKRRFFSLLLWVGTEFKKIHLKKRKILDEENKTRLMFFITIRLTLIKEHKLALDIFFWKNSLDQQNSIQPVITRIQRGKDDIWYLSSTGSQGFLFEHISKRLFCLSVPSIRSFSVKLIGIICSSCTNHIIHIFPAR